MSHAETAAQLALAQAAAEAGHQAPAAAPLLCSPPQLDFPHRFAAAAGGARAMERAVLRPVDLSVTHGLALKAENLRRMVETYDPALEAAMLNFDHQWGGPSHGHCTRLWMEGEFLWTRFERLSAEAVSGIENGQWTRCSSEFYSSHPVIKDWYFVGLALLGSKYPAVPGLGDARLLSRPVHRVITLTSETRSESAEHAAPANGEEKTEDGMTKKNEGTPAGAETTTPDPTPPPATPATTDEPTAAQLSAQVESLSAGVAADRAQLATELSRLRGERAELNATSLLSTRLEKKLTPAQVKLARPLIVALAAAATAPAVKLAGADGKETEVSILERFVQILEAGPDFGSLFGHLAQGDPGERSSVALSAAEQRAGLTAEEAARIEAKYPSAFNEPN